MPPGCGPPRIRIKAPLNWDFLNWIIQIQRNLSIIFDAADISASANSFKFFNKKPFSTVNQQQKDIYLKYSFCCKRRFNYSPPGGKCGYLLETFFLLLRFLILFSFEGRDFFFFGTVTINLIKAFYFSSPAPENYFFFFFGAAFFLVVFFFVAIFL